MPGKLLEIDVDARDLIAALDHLGERAEQLCLAAARETGEAIKQEAEARVRRATGTLQDAITVQDAPPPLGGVWVLVGPMRGRSANFPLWHEFGTKFLQAQPYFFTSARLEETNHLRRVAEAVQDAIDAEGLGG